jgi:alpha-beta hydrolase superfamily lysophospholipase
VLLCCCAAVPVTQGVGKRKTYAGSWVEALNQAGYSCAGIDNRGCGRSMGLFGYVNDHTDWVNDLVRTLDNSNSCILLEQ